MPRRANRPATREAPVTLALCLHPLASSCRKVPIAEAG